MDQPASEKESWTLPMTALLGALTALSAVGTMVIRIPIPATTGYFNIGDVFVILAGLWLGPIPGLLVGAVGPTIADAVGFPQFIVATSIVKGLEGFLVGLVGSYKSSNVLRWKSIAAAIGGITIVTGYFVFEAFVYPFLGKYVPFFRVTDLGAALIEIGPNCVQATVSAVVGIGLWRAVSGFNPRTNKVDILDIEGRQ